MRILEYHEGLELGDPGDQDGFRTMSSAVDLVLLKSVDLNIGLDKNLSADPSDAKP